MPDMSLLAGRLIFLALMYLFLFAMIHAGIGVVRGQRKDSAIWFVTIEKGPREVRGVSQPIMGPIVIGRSPSSDMVIPEQVVSATHARLSLSGNAPVVEDMRSTNGTFVNGAKIDAPVMLSDGDEIQIGDAIMRVASR